MFQSGLTGVYSIEQFSPEVSDNLAFKHLFCNTKIYNQLQWGLLKSVNSYRLTRKQSYWFSNCLYTPLAKVGVLKRPWTGESLVIQVDN
jgi:hypothetical protein